MATTLLNGAVLPNPVEVGEDGVGDLGILHQAKSLEGSHISATAEGRYAPTDVASEDPTFWDVRRIMPRNVPLCFLLIELLSGEAVEFSICESLIAGLKLRSRRISEPEDGGGDGSIDGRRWDPPNLNMCTVSVAEETQRREDVVLKDMQYICEVIAPRRN